MTETPGRPPMYNESMKQVSLYLRQDQIDWLQAQPKGMAATIRRMIDERMDDKMYSISIDNGLSDTTPETAINKLGMDVIRNMMDDKICMVVETECPRNDVEFINLYLQHAPIVIG